MVLASTDSSEYFDNKPDFLEFSLVNKSTLMVIEW